MHCPSCHLPLISSDHTYGVQSLDLRPLLPAGRGAAVAAPAAGHCRWAGWGADCTVSAHSSTSVQPCSPRTAPSKPTPPAMAGLGPPSAALQPRLSSIAAHDAGAARARSIRGGVVCTPAAAPAGGSGWAASGRQLCSRLQVRRALRHELGRLGKWQISSCLQRIDSDVTVAPAPPALLQLQPAVLRHAAKAPSGCRSSGGGTASNGSSETAPRKKLGPPFSPVPDVDAGQLLRSLGLSGAADPAVLLRNLRKLPGVRQQGVLNNAAGVAAHLRSPAVGLTAQQVGQLLERCPYLFSWPPEQRAAMLFGQLLGAGLTAAEAALCFMALPSAALYTTLAPGLAELAAILAHSEDRDSSLGGRTAKVPAAQRTVAALLSQSPSAVRLVCHRAGYLQQCAAELQQGGYTAAQVAAVAWVQPALLRTAAAAKVADVAAVLQQELGMAAAAVESLVVARHPPRWLANDGAVVQVRAAALAKVGIVWVSPAFSCPSGWVPPALMHPACAQASSFGACGCPLMHALPPCSLQTFGREAVVSALLRQPEALSCSPTVWRRNLCYMAACGVADPKAVLLRAASLLYKDHAAAGFLQRRLLLQRAFGLMPAQLYGQHPCQMVRLAPTELAQRLQFVERRGQTRRLVAKATRGRKPAAASAEEWRPALSLVAVTGALERFLPAVGASQAEWEAWVAANPPEACTLYRWAQQAAAEEATRLAAALPPELQPAASGEEAAAASSGEAGVQV